MDEAWEQIRRHKTTDRVRQLPKLTRVAALFVGPKLDTLEIR